MKLLKLVQRAPQKWIIDFVAALLVVVLAVLIQSVIPSVHAEPTATATPVSGPDWKSLFPLLDLLVLLIGAVSSVLAVKAANEELKRRVESLEKKREQDSIEARADAHVFSTSLTKIQMDLVRLQTFCKMSHESVHGGEQTD